MILFFRVDEVAILSTPAFDRDPNDPRNTIPVGQNIQRVSMSVIPDVLMGGKGLLAVQLNTSDQIGRFKPGDKVRVEMTVEG